MSGTQRARSGVPLARRSALPTIPGVPAWGAVAIAAVAMLLGFLIDAVRGTELTSAFSVFYFLGCLAAVLAVRNRGLFTAMVQPPLLLVVAVPLAYQFFSPGGAGLKDLAFNVAIPLVNRFPLMALTTATVVVIGAARMYIRRQAGAVARQARKSGSSRRPGASQSRRDDAAQSRRDDAAQSRRDDAAQSRRDDVTATGTPLAETDRPDTRVAEQQARRADVPPGRPAHAPGSFPTGRYPSRARYSGPPEEETATFDRPQQSGRSPRPDVDMRPARPQPQEPPRREPPRHEPPSRELPRYESMQDRSAPGSAPHRARPNLGTPDGMGTGRPQGRHRDPETPLHPIPQVRYRDRGEQDPPSRYR
ncbi:DUF6542 domain-containing protein [Rhodococcus gannanensis]|uniref:DUF6542 domain-containing protein n=1 Tax=Rhodococcus gannanensis TaxID=1960308 RepID=A0ABW4NZZ6_9NOCA